MVITVHNFCISDTWNIIGMFGVCVIYGFVWVGFFFVSSWMGVAFLNSLNSTHLDCLFLQLTWPTLSPIICSIKAWFSSLFFASVLLCLSGPSVLGAWKLCVFSALCSFLAPFCYIFWVRSLDHGLYAAALSKLHFVSFPCPARTVNQAWFWSSFHNPLALAPFVLQQ